MRLVLIDTDKEPQCLETLRTNGHHYIDLKGECKNEVRAELSEQQKSYCAYCERKLDPLVFIEHYISQSQDPSQELVFSNFLGVCSGKYYLDKMTGKFIPHCGDSRQSLALSINPKTPDHIDTIYYTNDAEIRSDEVSFYNDLNQTLNLNFSELKELRQNEFKNSLSLLLEVASLQNWTKEMAYGKALNSSQSGSTEFSSYLAFRYGNLLAELQ